MKYLIKNSPQELDYWQLRFYEILSDFAELQKGYRLKSLSVGFFEKENVGDISLEEFAT